MSSTPVFKGVNVTGNPAGVAGLTKAISISKSGNVANQDKNAPNMPKCICQTVTASVQVSLNTYYEIGSDNAYRVMGRPSGSGSISNIMGPTKEALTTVALLCDVCNPHDLNITFINKACNTDTNNGGMIFKDVVCNQVQVNADAAQDLITGTWQFVCTNVEQLQ